MKNFKLSSRWNEIAVFRADGYYRLILTNPNARSTSNRKLFLLDVADGTIQRSYRLQVAFLIVSQQAMCLVLAYRTWCRLMGRASILHGTNGSA